MEKITKTFSCRKCGKLISVEVYPEDLENYESGKLFIQEAFPYLTPGERELFLSGICEECFDKMFPKDEDDIEDEVYELDVEAKSYSY